MRFEDVLSLIKGVNHWSITTVTQDNSFMCVCCSCLLVCVKNSEINLTKIQQYERQLFIRFLTNNKSVCTGLNYNVAE